MLIVGAILSIISMAIFAYLIHKLKKRSAVYKMVEKIRSRCDGNLYFINKNFKDYDKALCLLSGVNERVNRLIKHMKANFPADERTKNLISRFNPRAIVENSEGDDTSYTINKGEELFLCLRNRDTGELHDINTLMFVVLHELSHIAETAFGHGPTFWKTFAFMLNIAEKLKVYENVNYRYSPKYYCKLNIDSNPYYNQNTAVTFKMDEKREMSCNKGECFVKNR